MVLMLHLFLKLFFTNIYIKLQDNKCQGGTGFLFGIVKEETVLWDDNSKLKEEKKWIREKIF